MLLDFLQTKRSPAELRTALEVIREFKACESQEEYMGYMFATWHQLEHLEAMLESLLDGTQIPARFMDSAIS